MKAEEVCDGCMVEFGDNELGATVGEVAQRDDVEQVQVWPADTGSGIGPDKRWIPIAALRTADMDRWMYDVRTGRFSRKLPGVLLPDRGVTS